MTDWNEFCDDLKKGAKIVADKSVELAVKVADKSVEVASKVADKSVEFADTATIRLKIARNEARLSNLYEKLGKITYDEVVSSNGGENADDLIKKITDLKAENLSLRKIIEDKKQK